MNTVFVLTHESNPQRKSKSLSIIALALTRALGRMGVPVVRVHPNHLDHSLASRYCRQVEICPDLYASEKELLDFLCTMAGRYSGLRVLIPGSDDCANFVAQYRSALSEHYAVVAPDWQVMRGIIDKRQQYEQAQALGIPIPETYFPQSLGEVQQLAGRLLHFPYVIKPLVAHAWRRASMQGVSHGKKGFAAANVEELLEHYERIAAGDRQVMIQEVIGGADECLFTFLGYFDAQSQPRAYCVRRKIRQFPLDFGYCTLTETCLDSTVVAQSLRLLQGLHYQGLVGVEWKHDPRTGIYKLIEINARAVNTSGIAPACGVNLPYLAYLDQLGQAPALVDRWQQGVKWSNLEQDFWAARELHRQGKLSLLGWFRSLAGCKVDAVYAADDRRPFFSFLRESLARRMGRLFRRKPRPVAVAPAPVLSAKAAEGAVAGAVTEENWWLHKRPAGGMRQSD